MTMPSVPVAQTLSGKNFREPLLRVLGTKMKFELGAVVSFETTYDPICAMMGITRTQYGNCSTGTPNVERWIQFAYKDLCDEGLAEKAGRGKWTLTQSGVAASSALCGPKAAPQGNTMSTVPSAPETLSLAIGPGNPEDGYHPDPYIRSLAVSRTGCFSCASEQSPLCTACPIKGICVNGLSAEFTQLAKQLAAEDAETEKRAEAARKAVFSPQPVSVPTPVAVQPLPAPQPAIGAVGVAFRMINLSAEGSCRKCDGAIPIKDRCVWSRASAGSSGSALYHKDCFKAQFPGEYALLEADEKAKKR